MCDEGLKNKNRNKKQSNDRRRAKPYTFCDMF